MLKFATFSVFSPSLFISDGTIHHMEYRDIEDVSHHIHIMMLSSQTNRYSIPQYLNNERRRQWSHSALSISNKEGNNEWEVISHHHHHHQNAGCHIPRPADASTDHPDVQSANNCLVYGG